MISHGRVRRARLVRRWDHVIIGLGYYANMRTTIDIPDALFRKTKATSALRGTSLKALIVSAIEKEVSGATVGPAGKKAG